MPSGRILISKRKSLISNSLSIAYKNPIQFLEGKYQYLYDDKGRQYLDCVNNISHVGHCNPKVHEALVKQNEKALDDLASLKRDSEVVLQQSNFLIFMTPG